MNSKIQITKYLIQLKFQNKILILISKIIFDNFSNNFIIFAHNIYYFQKLYSQYNKIRSHLSSFSLTQPIKMQNIAKKNIIYLLQPKQQFNEHFFIIRNHLNRWRIPFQQEYGFKQIQNIQNDNKYHYIVIINNSNIDPKQIPDFKLTPSMEVYTYPLHNPRFQTLSSPIELVNRYESTRNSFRSSSNTYQKIRMKSLKKNVQRAHFVTKDIYSTILVCGTGNKYSDYERLSVLLQNEERVKLLKGKMNQLSRIVTSSIEAEKSKKILLITQIQNMNTYSSFINEQRFSNKVDIIVFGFRSEKTFRDPNIVLVTQDIKDILQFIQQNGIELEKAIPLYISQQRILKTRNPTLKSIHTDNEKTPTKKRKYPQKTSLSSSSQDNNNKSISTKKKPTNNNIESSSYSQESVSIGNINLINQPQLTNQHQYYTGNKYIPPIIELSQEYRGSNKQSFVAEEYSKINNRNMVDDNQNNRYKICNSQYRVQENNEKDSWKRSHSINYQNNYGYEEQGSRTNKQFVMESRDKDRDRDRYKDRNDENKIISKHQYADSDYQIVTIQQISISSENQQEKEKQKQKEKTQIKKLDEKKYKFTMKTEPVQQKIAQTNNYGINPQRNYRVYKNTSISPAQHMSSVPITNITHYQGMQNTYQNNSNSKYNQYTPRQQNKTNSVKISSGIDLSKYDRIVDERGRVIYRPKTVTSNNVQQYNTNRVQSVPKEPTYYSSYANSKQKHRNYTNYQETNKQRPKQQMKQQIEQKLVTSQYYSNSTNYKPKVVEAKKRTVNDYQQQSQHSPYVYSYTQNKYKDARVYNKEEPQKKDEIINSNITRPQTVATNNKYRYNYNDKKPIQTQKQVKGRVSEFNKYEDSSKNIVSNLNNSQPDEVRYSNSSIGTDDRKLFKDSSDYSALQYQNGQAHHGQLYNESKPFSYSSITKVQSLEQLARLQKQYDNLQAQPCCFHYIIQSNHPYAQSVMSHANYRDKIQVNANVHQLQQKILKKYLPNQIYDLGFILVNDIKSFNREYLRPGYFFIDIDQNYRQIHISKYKNQLKLSNFQNLELAQKLLLAPFIEHFLFYSKEDSDASKILKVFPTDRFHRSSYFKYSDLSQKIQAHTKTKGRLARIIILCNLNNIQEIARISQHNLNLNNFSIYCSLKDEQKLNLHSLQTYYPKVKFISDFNFNSYGSIIKYTPSNQINIENEIKKSKIQSKIHNSSLQPSIIYMDERHEKTLSYSLKNYLMNKYNLIKFRDDKEIKSDRNAIVLLHPHGDYVENNIAVRDYQGVYMVGIPQRRMPVGVVRIEPEDIVEIF